MRAIGVPEEVTDMAEIENPAKGRDYQSTPRFECNVADLPIRTSSPRAAADRR